MLSVSYSLIGFIRIETWQYYQHVEKKMKHNAFKFPPMTDKYLDMWDM